MTTESACVVVFNEEGQALLVSRKQNDKHWGFPGGNAREMEMPLDCALRKLFEETGLQLKARDLVPVVSMMAGSSLASCFVCIHTVARENVVEGFHSAAGKVQWSPIALSFQGPFQVHNKRVEVSLKSMGYIDLNTDKPRLPGKVVGPPKKKKAGGESGGNGVRNMAVALLLGVLGAGGLWFQQRGGHKKIIIRTPTFFA